MVNILGAGLAGSILKRVLDQHKIKNRIFDCKKEWRASPISENLFSLSWAGTLGEKVVSNGVKTLESIANISSIRFKTKAGYNDVLHVHPDDLLVKDFIYGDVSLPTSDLTRPKDVTVDCRGYWTPIPHKEKMVGLTGQGLFIRGKMPMEPHMSFVAPYVHQKLFQWDSKNMWYGDSTCIEHSKYVERQDHYVLRCQERASQLLGYPLMPKGTNVVFGIRPWVKGHKGYLMFNKRYITNTGGWKCGLIIYSDHAQKILKYIQSL